MIVGFSNRAVNGRFARQRTRWVMGSKGEAALSASMALAATVWSPVCWKWIEAAEPFMSSWKLRATSVVLAFLGNVQREMVRSFTLSR